MSDKSCPKCQNNMELGFQADDVSRKSYRQSVWAPGPPEINDAKMLGMKLFEDWIVKVKEEELKRIVTFRCSNCGFLEQYAP